MTAAPRMVKLADLWQRKSAKGAVYFSGYHGPCRLLLFKDGKKPHPTKPDEEIIVWKLLIQEKDPERRPQQRREQNGRQPPTAGEAYAPPRTAPVTPADPGQHDAGDPSRPFNDDLPF
jgi:hypothetical protein